MLYNKIIEDFILPIGDSVLRTDFIRQLKYWRNEVAGMTIAELNRLQRDRLNALLQQTIATIPFYKRLNITLSGDPYIDTRLFPVMHKQLIKQHMNELYVGDRRKMVVEKSSGSSGIQGEVYMTRKENLGYQAVQTFLWEWSGYRLGDPLLQTGMTLDRSGVKGKKDKLLRTMYANAYNLSYEIVAGNLREAKRRGCRFFGGYASSLNVYAEIALKEKIDIRFKGVISWGDKLFDQYKSNLRKAFGDPVITELYGTTEGCVIAGTCEYGNYHMMSPHVYVELLDKAGNEVAPGELGYVVVTRLDAFHFPLIRYYLGDLAIKESGEKECPCGRHFPLMRKIVGRDTDIVYTPGGKALIVHFFTGIFEHFDGIRQFRVIQKAAGEITIEYIPSDTFSPEVLPQITKVMHERAVELFPVTYIPVEKIPDTPSGKPQIILNTIVKKLSDHLEV